jgi:hypothetical protein
VQNSSISEEALVPPVRWRPNPSQGQAVADEAEHTGMDPSLPRPWLTDQWPHHRDAQAVVAPNHHEGPRHSPTKGHRTVQKMLPRQSHDCAPPTANSRPLPLDLAKERLDLGIRGMDSWKRRSSGKRGRSSRRKKKRGRRKRERERHDKVDCAACR